MTLKPEEIEALAASFGIGPHSGKAFADALRAKWFATPYAYEERSCDVPLPLYAAPEAES